MSVTSAIRIMYLACWVQWAVWTMKLPRILERIEARPRVTVPREHVDRMIAFAQKLSEWKWFVIRKNCLKKNLLYYQLLVSANVTQLAIHVGVRNTDRQLNGHCWLTRDGEVYLDTERNVSSYQVMFTRGV